MDRNNGDSMIFGQPELRAITGNTEDISNPTRETTTSGKKNSRSIKVKTGLGLSMFKSMPKNIGQSKCE